MTMQSHYFAYLAKAMAVGFAYEKRDGDPSITEVKNTIDEIHSAFDAFKKKNDERLEQIEKRGSEDTVTRDAVEKVNAEITDLKSKLDDMTKRMSRPGAGGGSGEETLPEAKDHQKAFNLFLRQPDNDVAKRQLQDAEEKWRKAKMQADGVKAVDTTSDTSGGYAVPELISRRIERELSEISPLRNLVDVQQAGSKDFKILVDTRGLTYGWVGETDTRTETNTPGLQEVAPTFGMIYAYPKATEESLDDMFFNVENWLASSIVEGFSEGEENAIVNGNGTKKPTGFLNGTPTLEVDGVRAFGTLQYYRSGAAASFAGTDPVDPIISMVYGLKKGYRRNATFLMNKLTAGEVRKFKDGDGNYLWQPTITAGQPDSFLGYSVNESEEMPDVAADAFPIAFGDFKAGYVLADLVGFRLTRDEITTPGYVKWYARRRLGGKVKKSEAIKLLKIEAGA